MTLAVDEAQLETPSHEFVKTDDNTSEESIRSRNRGKDASSTNFYSSTIVQPKGLLQEYTLASQEHISQVFSTGTSLSRGIRSLPNALEPDFRRRLFEALVVAVKKESLSPKGNPHPHKTFSNNGLIEPFSPLSATMGFRTITKVHPRSGDFSTSCFLSSEFDRERIAAKFDRLKSKVACVSPKEFIIKRSPIPLQGTNCFSQLPRVPPSPERDVWLSHIHADNDKDGLRPSTSPNRPSQPFSAGGKVQVSTHLRGHADHVMSALGKLLQEDWPQSFHTCFIEDASQAIIACFDEVQAAQEGDLSSYMMMLAKSSHPVMSDYHLVKDGVQWGVRDADTASRFYAFWPPWAKKNKSLAQGKNVGNSEENLQEV